MQLAAGTLLGPYEVIRAIGAGGMGEVYRAWDSRIGRDVAIKILSANGSEGSERIRRFEQEARATARVSHPNVLAIHDVGTHAGSLFLVTELLEGETLREQLKRGSLSRAKVLDYASQIASGLAAAHDKHVVHRDLKPENLFICGDGRLKILDFGLAKFVETGGSGDGETATLPLETASGTLLGTAGYMSPEQVRGQAADHRSDIFSFGVILREMLTGANPFQRATAVETMNAILNEDPLESSPAAAEPLEQVVRRCIDKNREDRFQSARDVGFVLEMLRAQHLQPPKDVLTAAPARPLNWRHATGAALIVAALVAAGLLVRSFAPTAETVSGVRFLPVATETADEIGPAWSADGRTLAYAARIDGVFQIFTRGIDSPVSARITSAPADCVQPFWSRDDSIVYYLSQGSLWAVGASGGAPRRVIENVAHRPGSTVALAPDGRTFALFRAGGIGAVLHTADASGKGPQPYRRAPFPESVRYPLALQFSPDGRQLLVAAFTEIGPHANVAFWKLPYPDGQPVRIPVSMPPNARTVGLSWMADNRRFVMSVELRQGAGYHLYSVDSDTGAMLALTAGPSEELHPAVSRDGRIAFTTGGTDWDLYEVTADGKAVTPLLATSRAERFPVWAPGGRQYAYQSNANGTIDLWLRSRDGEWARRLVSGDAERAIMKHAFSPDGQRLVYVTTGQKHLIWILHVSGGRAAPLDRESLDQHAPAWSPDGHNIAYTRFVNGRWEIVKAASGGNAAPVHVTRGGDAGGSVEWSPSGKWICSATQAGFTRSAPRVARAACCAVLLRPG